MNPWKKLRLPVLIITFTSALFVFGRTITDSSIGKRTATPFVFPSAVPLSQWQFVSSKPLPNQIVEQLL
ncbi:MAG TPA: cyanoexosortase A system-associated protein, partial [Cyanobacteria bacterium UBA11049]|nr:cyanoexosortase A system-associated protein [Cyanobacteria bacterium UBA11049]